jgi:hypothetical protein
MPTNCIHCNLPTPEPYVNYCSWECQIDEAKELGGKLITPNNLPVVCIKANGDMLENEHADHPDYKFPIKIEWTNLSEDILNDPSEINEWHPEHHAVIYCDGYVALTLYECCYSMWYLSSGTDKSFRSKKQKIEPYQKISDEALEMLRKKFPKEQ